MADKKKADRKEFQLITPEFRGSFVTLNKPRAFGDGNAKYSITILLPEDDAFWAKLESVIEKCALKRFEKIPPRLKSPIRDGSETEYEDWDGHKFVQASSEQRPGCVDTDLEDIVERGELYSGAWYRASIRAYAWHYPKMNKKGVSLELDNVMKVRDDEPFSGKSSAMDDFAGHVDRDDDEDERPRSRKSRGNARDEGHSALD